ncbi:hypothetical protein CGG88_03005, partial [Vibrio parahaemolyticus]
MVYVLRQWRWLKQQIINNENEKIKELGHRMTQVLVIKSEKEFLNYAHGVLVNGEEEQTIKFDGWPTVILDIKGNRYHSSLPTKLMEGLVSFQQEVDKAYTCLQYNTSNRQKLTNADKDILELVFTIKEGSTEASSGGSDWVNGLLDKLDVVFKGMSGRQKTALLALLVLSVTGAYVGVSFLDGQNQVAIEKQKSIASVEVEKERTEQLKTLTETSNLGVQALRDAVLDKALEESPEQGIKVVEHIEEGYKNVVKSVPDADQLSIGDTTLSKSDIKRISAKPDVVKDVDESTDVFFIESIKKKPDYMIVGVVAVDSDLSFNIKVDTSFLMDNEKEALHDAFRDENSINLKYQANLKNGEIVNAR